MNTKNVSLRLAASRFGLVVLLAFSLSSAVLLTACSSSDAQEGATAAQEATIEATVIVAEDAEAGVDAQEVAVSVPEGATAYDALVESGIEIVASDSEYGKYIESVAGVAGTSTSGWVYTVNGQEVTVGCDSYELAAGDVVEWSYITW